MVRWRSSAPAREQLLLDLLVERDVGAPEAVDRLLRIADQEQLSGDGRTLRQSVSLGIVGREEQQDFGLERIGVLELVDEEVREALLQLAPHAGVAANEIARLDQEVEEIEAAGLRL